uniref:Uncharacterized protein n=1 Tax=Glossina brevipalpis TaxID=37001 RepID=A0A1A9WXM0_9MUSC
MISWILIVATFGEIAVIDVTAGTEVDSVLNHKRECLTEEGLNADLTSGDDLLDTIIVMFQFKPELVPYEAKCFLRCVLKKTSILKDDFAINKNVNIKGWKPDIYCEREAKALSNGDECQFAFAFAKCSPELMEVEILQTPKIDTLLHHKQECLVQEGLYADICPDNDLFGTFFKLFKIELDQVPYENKCFLRCLLKKTHILKDNFIINKALNLLHQWEPAYYCEREAEVLSNGDECDFAFVFARCSPDVINLEIKQIPSQKTDRWLNTLSGLRTICLDEEGLSSYMFPHNKMREIYAAMIKLKSEQVPYDAKCFLRCWLRKMKILHDNFVIVDEGDHNWDDENIKYCEREAKVLCNGDECEFAFAFLKCVTSPS